MRNFTSHMMKPETGSVSQMKRRNPNPFVIKLNQKYSGKGDKLFPIHPCVPKTWRDTHLQTTYLNVSPPQHD